MRQELSYICYLDDDGNTKKKHIVILEERPNYIKFKFSDGDLEITIPWHRINKIKRRTKKDE